MLFLVFLGIKMLEKCYLLKLWYVPIEIWVYFPHVFALYAIKKKILNKKLYFYFMNKKRLYKSKKEA